MPVATAIRPISSPTSANRNCRAIWPSCGPISPRAGVAADAAPDAGAPDAGFTGHRKARGRHPRSKPIEGYFAIRERQLYRRLGGLGYCKKQDNPDDNLKLEQGLRADAQAGRLLHYTEFAALVAEVVNWWNSHELSTDRIVPSREFFDDLARHPKPVFDA